MILLISKTCKFCEEVEDVDKTYSNIQKIYVEDGFANVNGEKVKLDPGISELPCLIDGNKYFFRVATILEYLRSN